MAVRERMRRELGDPVFEAWIGPLSLESFDHDELKIGAAKLSCAIGSPTIMSPASSAPSAPRAPSPPRFPS